MENKSNRDNEINVVFMGGSITCGSNATSYERSWAFLVSEWLKKRLCGARVNIHNAAIPGTGTRFGAFRLQSHVLACNPDLIFIEFAVNDSLEAQKDENGVIASLEYIVRTLLQHNPRIKIVFIYSAKQDWKACSVVHEKVASHYGIASIDMQTYFKALIEKGRYSWDELMTDHVHPGDLGYKVYADYIIQKLDTEWNAIMCREYTAGKSLVPPMYCFPRIIGFNEVKNALGWEMVKIHESNKHMEAVRVKEVLFADTPGSAFEISFYGTHFGLYHNVSKDGGICSIVIDDGSADTQDMYYRDTDGDYVSFYYRNNLFPGFHRAVIKLIDGRNPDSTGYKVSIAGFLVD